LRRGVREVAVGLLSRREHTARELARKLGDRGFPAAEVARVLAELQEEDLQSDRRYVENYLRERVRRGYGPAHMRHELRRRGVPDELIEEGLHVADCDWEELAGAQRGLRFGRERPGSAAERARQWAFLQRRGFTAGQIRAALAAAEAPPPGSPGHEER